MALSGTVSWPLAVASRNSRNSCNIAGQQHGAAYVRTMVGEDWALVAVAGGAGGRLVGFVVVTPIASVVPLSL